MAVTVAVCTPLVTKASSNPEHHAGRFARTVSVTFRLHVSGEPDLRTTYWVAYGPLAGQWGVIQLHPWGAGTYGALRALPSSGHTIFRYLAAQGTVKTRFGPAPGGRVVTIQAVGPVSAAQLSRYRVEWQAPVG